MVQEEKILALLLIQTWWNEGLAAVKERTDPAKAIIITQVVTNTVVSTKCIFGVADDCSNRSEADFLFFRQDC